jgi:hypothetical protein
MLSVNMLSVTMLSVIMLNVVILSVAAPVERVRLYYQFHSVSSYLFFNEKHWINKKRFSSNVQIYL